MVNNIIKYPSFGQTYNDPNFDSKTQLLAKIAKIALTVFAARILHQLAGLFPAQVLAKFTG